MQTPTLVIAGLAGALLTAATGVAQQQQEKKQPRPAIKAVRAMRLTAAGATKPTTPAELKQRYEKKLAGAWIKNANWITDYDQAKAAAAESGKPLFAYFTRSYAP